MKTLIIICVTILTLLACQKIPYIPCDCGNYGYLTITAQYQWVSLKNIWNNTGEYRCYWLGWSNTRNMTLPVGRYEIGYADPQIKTDQQRTLMLKNAYAPMPSIWKDDSIIIKTCDTLKLRY